MKLKQLLREAEEAKTAGEKKEEKDEKAPEETTLFLIKTTSEGYLGILFHVQTLKVYLLHNL